MFRRIVVATLIVVGLTAGPALAQSASLDQPITEIASVAGAIQFVDVAQRGVADVPREISQPGKSWTTPVFAALHAMTLTSQALDVHSTLRALDKGAVEANPLMIGVVQNRAAFITVKAAMGAGLVYATHRLGQRNKVAAIAMAAAVNSAALYVAHRNYAVARTMR